MKQPRFFQCSKNEEHYICLQLTDSETTRMQSKFERGKAVCPHCKPENSPMVLSQDPEANNKFAEDSSVIICKHGHITRVSAFKNGMLNFSWGNNFENIEGYPEDLDDILKEFKCRHLIQSRNGSKFCDSELERVDDGPSVPNTPGLKIKVRVGDIWDKAKVPEPRKGGYDKDFNYRPSEFERANARRLKDMRDKGKIEVFDDKTNKRKFIKRDRITKKPNE